MQNTARQQKLFSSHWGSHDHDVLTVPNGNQITGNRVGIYKYAKNTLQLQLVISEISSFMSNENVWV